MNPKSRRFAGSIAAATVGIGATAAALLLAPATSGAADSPTAALIAGTDEPDDTSSTSPQESGDVAPDSAGPGFPDGPGFPGGPGGPEFPGRPDRVPGQVRVLVRSAAVIADAIGIDVETLRKELRNGSTVAEIAAANGVDPQVVIDALVADYTERVTAWIEQDQLAREADDPEPTATTVA